MNEPFFLFEGRHFVHGGATLGEKIRSLLLLSAGTCARVVPHCSERTVSV